MRLMLFISGMVLICASGCESSYHKQERRLYNAEWREWNLAMAETHSLSNWNYHIDQFEDLSKQRAIHEGVYQ